MTSREMHSLDNCNFHGHALQIRKHSTDDLAVDWQHFIMLLQTRRPNDVRMVSSSAIQSASSAALGLVAGLLIRRRCDLATVVLVADHI